MIIRDKYAMNATIDIHLTIKTAGVISQWLLYADELLVKPFSYSFIEVFNCVCDQLHFVKLFYKLYKNINSTFLPIM